ncbi:hypothetical protein PHISCL_04558 [Aspergillus sclerotialis]|uniref:MobA-like NTP transferase domain-containing protein n=1 Tax=Aspergillus sclerotialis TaxID=2070753 RepID=A0A3A3A1B3_9EURO|nr:hypothetical protein PHISCL_04558 [Aspergillus sclerotialis]
MELKPLLLAGGCSSRMGKPKELLLLPSGQPMYMHLLSILHQACPESETVYFSQRDRKATEALMNDDRITYVSDNNMIIHSIDRTSMPVRVIHDYKDDSKNNVAIGPAAGLLAAHHQYPDATWLVAACDYPLLCPSALLQLRDEVSDSVTCFCNEDGFCEPLLGIWTPKALRMLEENVQRGIFGPSSIPRQHQGKLIRPRESQWLFNANTPVEWERAIELMKIRNLE